MNEIVVPVLLGIASSLVATIILLGISWFFKNVLLPWYADNIYRGVRLDGSWNCTQFGDMTADDRNPLPTMQIKQKGEVVKGSYQHGKNDVQNGTTLSKYKVSGYISNSFLTLSMTPIENDNIDAFTGILHIYNKGHKLEMSGKGLFIQSDLAKVNYEEIITFEKSSN